MDFDTFYSTLKESLQGGIVVTHSDKRTVNEQVEKDSKGNTIGITITTTNLKNSHDILFTKSYNAKQLYVGFHYNLKNAYLARIEPNKVRRLARKVNRIFNKYEEENIKF